ncbi:MAG: methyltransferase domain-containing protein [Polyangiales bacterium]
MTDEEIAASAAGLLTMMDTVERSSDCVARRAQTLDLLALPPSATALDVGCGAGTALIELGRRARGHTLIGVDINERMLAVARARAARAAVACALHEASSEALPLASQSVDGVRCERLLQHLSDPLATLLEMKRVLKARGRVALCELDWDAALVDSDDRECSRALVRAFANGSANATIGRKLHGLLRDAGFEDVRVEPSFALSTSWQDHRWFVELLATVGRVSEPCPIETIDRWLDEQRERAARDRFCVVIPWFVASATKPG